MAFKRTGLRANNAEGALPVREFHEPYDYGTLIITGVILIQRACECLGSRRLQLQARCDSIVRSKAEVGAMRNYIGLIHKDADSDFGVSFPDFPGVVTAGTTLDDARAMAEEALALHIDGLAEDGEAIPEPSSLEEVMSDPENRGAVAILVSVKTEQPKAVRVNVTLPEDVLEQIDKYAEAHGFTRSGLLTQAAKKLMGEAA
jgi:predicted RNase H-like HicB family nuclease